MSRYAKVIGRLTSADGLTIDVSINIHDEDNLADAVGADVLDMLTTYVKDMSAEASAAQVVEQTMDRLKAHASPFLQHYAAGW